MNSKKIAVLLLVFMLGLSFVSCVVSDQRTVDKKSGESTTDESQSASIDKVTQPEEQIIPEIRVANITGVNQGIKMDIINRFMEDQSEYKIVDAGKINFDDTAFVLSLIASGDVPDVVYSGDIKTYCWLSVHSCLEDWSKVIEKYPGIYKPEEWNADILKSSNMNGVQAALFPSNSAEIVIYYRKDKWEEAGIDPEKTPVNFSETIDMCKKLVKFDSKGKAIQAGLINDNDIWQWMWACGVEFLSRDMRTANLDNDIMKAIYEFFIELEKAYGGNDNWSPDIPQKFVDGTVTMILNGDVFYGGVMNEKEAQEGVKWGVFPVPRPDFMASDSKGGGRYINYPMILKGAKNIRGALVFSLWGASKGVEYNEKARFDTNPINYFPRFCHNKAANEYLIKELTVNFGESATKALPIVLENKKRFIISGIREPDFNSWKDNVWPIIFTDIPQKKVSISEGLANAQKIAQQQLDTWWKTYDAAFKK